MEHEREVRSLYNENIGMRNELDNCANLLQASIDREKQLHDLSDHLYSVFHETAQLAGSMHMKGSANRDQKNQLADPLNVTRTELQRIQQILGAPPIPPPDLHELSLLRASSTPVQTFSAAPQLPRLELASQNLVSVSPVARMYPTPEPQVVGLVRQASGPLIVERGTQLESSADEALHIDSALMHHGGMTPPQGGGMTPLQGGAPVRQQARIVHSQGRLVPLQGPRVVSSARSHVGSGFSTPPIQSWQSTEGGSLNAEIKTVDAVSESQPVVS